MRTAVVRASAWTLAGALAVSLLPARATVAQDASKAPAKSDEIATALGKQIDEAVAAATDGDFWGTLLVVRGGQIELAKGYGFRDYESKPNTPDTLFEIASTSKQVTATAILRLEQQKRLKTSDSIAKYFKDTPADKTAITIDQLLHHTAGLDPDIGVAYSWVGSRDEYLAVILKKPLIGTPGAKFFYSNVGYALLAAIVEVVTGRPFEDYVRKELFAPAGLVDTGFVQDEALVKSDRVTKRHSDVGDPDWTAAKWFYGWGYRGMGG